MLGVIFLTIALSPSFAFAQSSKQLSEYISYQEQIVLGVNFDELRKSKYYSMAEEMAKSSAAINDMLTLLDEAGVDFSTDITALTMGVPLLDVEKSLAERTYSVAISGKFDSKKLLETLQAKKVAFKTSELGKKKLYTADNIAFTFPKDGVLLVTSGPDAYRTRALSPLKGADKSVTKAGYFQRIFKDVKSASGVWVVANAASGPNPKSKELAVSLDISSGLAAEILMEMVDETSAAAALEHAQAQIQASASNPMLAMVGAKPLLTNIKSTHKGTRVTHTTKMSPQELDVLVRNARGFVEGQMKKQMGAKSGSAKPAADGKAPAPAGPVKTIKADFD